MTAIRLATFRNRYFEVKISETTFWGFLGFRTGTSHPPRSVFLRISEPQKPSKRVKNKLQQIKKTMELAIESCKLNPHPHHLLAYT